MSDGIEAAAKNALWFIKKGNDTKSQTDGVKSAIAGVSTVGFASKTISQLDNTLPDSNLKATASALADNSSIFKAAKTAGSICGDLTNACMYANSIYNVVTDEDKPKAAVEEGAGLLAMTACEQGFKKANVSEMIEKIPVPEKFKIIKPIAAAVAYVAASIAGSKGGRKIGEEITGRTDKDSDQATEVKE